MAVMFLVSGGKTCPSQPSDGGGKMSRPTIALIFNPARGDKAARFRAAWPTAGRWPCSRHSRRQSTGLARQAVKDGFRTVVASGGDGTINESSMGLAKCHEPWAGG